MLVLARKEGQRVRIRVARGRNESPIDVWVELVEATPGYARIGFIGPAEASVYREEIVDRMEEEETDGQ